MSEASKLKLMQDPNSAWVKVWNPEQKSLSHIGAFLNDVAILIQKVVQLEKNLEYAGSVIERLMKENAEMKEKTKELEKEVRGVERVQEEDGQFLAEMHDYLVYKNYMPIVKRRMIGTNGQYYFDPAKLWERLSGGPETYIFREDPNVYNI
jgi:hypothetical protein